MRRNGEHRTRRPSEYSLRHRSQHQVLEAAGSVRTHHDHDARPRILKRLARETGGEVFTPRRPSDVGRSFEQIARELRSGYTIGVQPPEMADGGFRAIRVVVDAGDGRRLVARTRAGYYAGR